ncbi:MAG: type II toxin-antitoxin system ParD family antitoxin [Candidatus Methanofishera endochildressiae]|uniref:Antitoxin ParD n=1 Tax=Candidatus Methanofishera endochildressiae TaxID=2738884 RepID=A0A7Z0SF48_9GAMM|nr:type II toxin-antitoxin system ParD family antitoxin [Candidatus Methanofishera endochildressiae]
MNLSLTPQLEIFIRECAESGDYNNASEVVRDAIRLFKRTAEERNIKLQQLRAAIAEGDAAISRGESHVFNSEEELDNFFEQL